VHLRSVFLAGVVRVETGAIVERCGQTWWVVSGEWEERWRLAGRCMVAPSCARCR
jgi:hypothetical protein